jgi:hypothetical protein
MTEISHRFSVHNRSQEIPQFSAKGTRMAWFPRTPQETENPPAREIPAGLTRHGHEEYILRL